MARFLHDHIAALPVVSVIPIFPQATSSFNAAQPASLLLLFPEFSDCVLIQTELYELVLQGVADVLLDNNFIIVLTFSQSPAF